MGLFTPNKKTMSKEQETFFLGLDKEKMKDLLKGLGLIGIGLIGVSLFL